jgi:tRNA dimethylallyltransferase
MFQTNAQELGAVPHHFINSHSINQDFKVVAPLRKLLSLAKIEELYRTQYCSLIMVSGSGLFIRNAVL